MYVFGHFDGISIFIYMGGIYKNTYGIPNSEVSLDILITSWFGFNLKLDFIIS